jgi:2,4-dienoyl-CoA reductase-like NADH-dependent reductase (Old Yellow Enzyme family)
VTQSFPNLFTPFRIKDLVIRNRIFSTGHDTDLGEDGLPGAALIAYQRARAKGGAGLIVVQVVAVHDTARYTSKVLMGTSDSCIGQFTKLFAAIHGEGAAAFVQIFHPGRELLGRVEGIAQVAYAPSPSPSERFRIAPRALSHAGVKEIIGCYGATARRMAEAGADGVEVVANHGYLPSQFMSAQVNRRRDEFGGSFENRMRFTRDVAAAIRRETPPEVIVGLRFSCDEFDPEGLADADGLKICRHLRDDFDYFNVIAGTSASASGAQHIVPPMSVENAYLAPFASQLKQSIGKPVFVAGRINQPQEAERILTEGAADMCGMTRALISDPEMPIKAKSGRPDDIRACIACNQACIGHAQLGLPISCIQFPESGRELQFPPRRAGSAAKKVMVVGGGPGGMKAAAVAAELGHRVILFEQASRLGGQALIAQLLPQRAEFGGIVTNLAREVELAAVRLHLNALVDGDRIADEAPDRLIIATGGLPQAPPMEAGPGIAILQANDVLTGNEKTGSRVVIYDWLADWTGVGIAEKLALEGAHVRLAVNGPCAAASIQNYVRDAAIARLHCLGVEVIPFMRLYGAEDRTVFFTHTASRAPVVLEDVDTLVHVYPVKSQDHLAAAAEELDIDVRVIGDARAPRTAEEAVFEGLKAATESPASWAL